MNRKLFVYYLIGLASLLVAAASVVDLFAPKPWDGITPAMSRGISGIEVVEVDPESAAARAGIEPGDRILGIGGKITNTPAEAAAELVRHRIGEPVSYLVRRDETPRTLQIVPDATLVGNPFYVYDAILGLLFFAIGLFVLTQRPDDSAAQVFFLLCDLFLVFLLCRLRPSSYYWLDYFVLNAGTVALFLLPAVFLHFFLIFPERKRFNLLGEDDPYAEAPSAFRIRLDRWVNQGRTLFALLYFVPPVAFLLHVVGGRLSRQVPTGAPAINWILLGNYMVLGLLALAHSWFRVTDERKRRQLLPVLVGAIVGTTPFIFFSIILPSLTHDDRYVLFGTIPLVLIPLTFGYAIVRYQVMNVKLVVRRGILYALTTALVTALYAIAIATANRLLAIFGGEGSILPFALGVGVVLLFDPIRRRMQAPIDRIFFRERADFAYAVREMSELVRGELSLDRIKSILAERTIAVTRASGGWLCLPSGDEALICETGTGEDNCPPPLPAMGKLVAHLRAEAEPKRIEALSLLDLDEGSAGFVRAARTSGVKVAVPMVFRERLLGILFLKEKLSEQEYVREELEVLSTLANQAAVALETAQLHAELTRQVELARDLEIAREIQMSLFPRNLQAPPGFELYADSIPAKVVGGDFYDVFPFTPSKNRPEGAVGLVLGDVSGKSIPAALLMVASREILWAAAQGGAAPNRVFRDANARIYSIKRRMFVALGYYVLDPASRQLLYSIAGMPTPLLSRSGEREALTIPPPDQRLPLGSLREVPYDACSLQLRSGDLLLLYSDGFSETMAPNGEPFGDDRLARLIHEHRDEPLPKLGDRLMSELRRFSEGADPYDDMTFLLLRVGEKPVAAVDVPTEDGSRDSVSR